MPAQSASAPSDKIERLTHGERWFLDGFSVMQLPGGWVTRLCDMSQSQRVVTLLRQAGIAATYTHVVVRAVALALSRCPESHQIVCGYRRMRPSRVDIGLSVAGQTSYAPVLVIEDAASRPLADLVQFLKEEVPKTHEKELRDLEGMKRNGWLVPIGWLRRMILRLLGNMFWFRRKLVGTFQMTCLRHVDSTNPLMFYSGAALGVGEVRDRVVAIAGRPEVRPTVILSMPFDHRTLDGKQIADLLATLCSILESDELLNEVSHIPHIEAANPVLPPPVAMAEPLSTASVSAVG